MAPLAGIAAVAWAVCSSTLVAGPYVIQSFVDGPLYSSVAPFDRQLEHDFGSEVLEILGGLL
jgi:hypothetical protein